MLSASGKFSTIYQPMNQYKKSGDEVDPRYSGISGALEKIFVINRDGKASPLLFRPMAARQCAAVGEPSGTFRGVHVGTTPTDIVIAGDGGH